MLGFTVFRFAAVAAAVAAFAHGASASGTSAKWFRLTMKQKYDVPSSAATLSLAEFMLLDADGVRQSSNIVSVASDTVPADMEPGTCFVTTPYGVSGSAANLFDGKWVGNSVPGMSITGIPVGDNKYAAMSASDSSTWSYLTVRLPANAAPIVSYQLYVGYYNWSGTERSMSRWTLEASYDGETWIAVDDRSSANVSKPASNNSPYNSANSGAPFPVRPYSMYEATASSGGTVLANGVYGPDVRIAKTADGTNHIAGAFGEAFLDVSRGTLSVRSVAFKHYRFKVDRIRGAGGTYGTGDQSMEISEFKLTKGGTDVTANGLVSASNSPDGAGSPDAEQPSKAVDGRLDTKFNDRSTKTGDYDHCWLELEYDSPLAIDGYDWASSYNNYWSANDSRVPIAWRLQGSMDGETWFDLDTRDNHFNFTPKYTASTWQSEGEEGFPVPATHATGIVSVSSGAELSVSGDAELHGIVNAGTVSLESGARALFSPASGEGAFVSGGGVSGDGGIVMSGAGVLEMDGANSYAGDTVVESGTLRIGRGAALSAEWFRLVLKKKYNWTNSSGSILRLAEWALYDEDGEQQNLSLRNTSSPARLMGRGTCRIDTEFSVADNQPVTKLFDGAYVGQSTLGLYVSGVCTDDKGYPTMSVNDPSTWITVTLRMPDGAKPVSAYNLFVGYYNWSGSECSPSRWTLEASYDGETWFTVDDKTSVDTPSPGDHEAGYNGGTPYEFSASQGTPGATIPAASVVEVASGAVLDVVNAARTISALRIDASAGAGTISGFNPAASGVLHLVNAPALDRNGTVIPVTFENAVNTGNLAGWAVFADGVQRSAKFSIDALGVARVRLDSGLAVFVR